MATLHRWSGGGTGSGGGRIVPVPGEGVQLPVATGGSPVTVVQFVAHPDDGLYFMNPDAEQEIAAGHTVLTVCLTGGEADGRNFAPHDPRARHARPDRPGFVRARMNGLRRAHAVMATGDETSPWDVRVVRPISGWEAELHSLRAAPHVQLLFLALVEARGVAAWRPQSLKGLWQNAVLSLPQLLPAHSPMRQATHVTRTRLVACLQAILREYRPTVVRTLDPNPEHDPVHTGHRGYAPGHGLAYYDHQDHTHATYFVQQALAAHWATQARPQMSVEHYLGYVNAHLPWNLDGTAVRHKARLLDVYGWSDHGSCGDPSGCGDLKVGGGALHGAWVQSTRYRAPGASSWAARTTDGRLAGFALLSGQAVVWYETTAGGGQWAGPVPLEGRGLEGQVSVVVREGGALQLFSVRTHLPDTRGTGVHHREVVTAVQTGTARDGRPLFSAWVSLGTSEVNPVASMEMGFPEAAAGPDGSVYLAVRDQAGGVSVRVQSPHGVWSHWARLPKAAESGVRVLDGLGVAVDSAGRAHVFAPGQRSILHWTSPGRGRPFALARPTGLSGSSGPISALAMHDGSVRLAYREPRSALVTLAELPASGGTARPLALSEPGGGFGRVAMAHSGPAQAAPGAVALATRNSAGCVSVATAGPALGPWSHGSAPHVHAPALAEDAQGRMVALAVGADGALWTVRPDDGGTGGGTARWAPAVPNARGGTAVTRAAGSSGPHSTGRTA
ncbi:PIG-L family deacetylase [Actinacidiphila acidipaludis]|uniref:PIG-L family deacetylase n=1 Tax=Actinacidiphila acidipaludis TaxID=2873382 RepID=A0ABS7Q3X4_9ACTN|nr:PIG-L family deacetylase [Streptomyces acidipaludis]MBY8877653.1 PIG-L family deacetylase [Streptomyces acidipaludis]